MARSSVDTPSGGGNQRVAVPRGTRGARSLRLAFPRPRQQRTVAGDALSAVLLDADCTIAVRMEDMRASVSGSPFLQDTSNVSLAFRSGVVTRACAARPTGQERPRQGSRRRRSAGAEPAEATRASGISAHCSCGASVAKGSGSCGRAQQRAASTHGPSTLSRAARLINREPEAGNRGGDVGQQARPVGRHDGHLSGSAAREQDAIHRRARAVA